MTRAPSDYRRAGRTAERRAACRWGSIFGWSLPALAAIATLGIVCVVRPSAAEARDLLILLSGETRRGELSTCDATACRLDRATVPRSDIVWIGLGDSPLPPPAVRNPLADELHLRDGAVRPGPLLSLDARRVVTPSRAYERREVRWIFLASAPATGSAGREPARREEDRDEDGTCGFWVGTLRQRTEVRSTRAVQYQFRRTIRTVYAARFKETARGSTPLTLTIGTRQVRATKVSLSLDRGAVREHLRGTLSGPGGNRIMGSGAGDFGDNFGGGSLVTEVPSGPTYYEVGLRGAEFRYRATVHANRGGTTYSDQGPLEIYVGRGLDPEQPRTMDPGSRVMKGEYTVTLPEEDHTFGRTVAWDLTRVTARCDAPPAVPPLPAESEPSDGDAPDADKP